MRRDLAAPSIVLLLLVSSCAYSLRPYNAPSQQKLLVQARTPTNCVVRVADAQDFPVAADGRVLFDVPPLPRGCAVYLFGAVKIRDGKPQDAPAIHVLSNGTVVRKLSLTQLEKLPVDAEGYHKLDLR